MCQTNDYKWACGCWHDPNHTVMYCANIGAGCRGVKPNPRLEQSRQPCKECAERAAATQRNKDFIQEQKLVQRDQNIREKAAQKQFVQEQKLVRTAQKRERKQFAEAQAIALPEADMAEKEYLEEGGLARVENNSRQKQGKGDGGCCVIL